MRHNLCMAIKIKHFINIVDIEPEQVHIIYNDMMIYIFVLFNLFFLKNDFSSA